VPFMRWSPQFWILLLWHFRVQHMDLFVLGAGDQENQLIPPDCDLNRARVLGILHSSIYAVPGCWESLSMLNTESVLRR
jgi:hypothetical protein